jgi:hypothetical protein
MSLQRVMSVGVRWAEWISFSHLISHRFAFGYLAFRYLMDFVIRYRWSYLEGFRSDLLLLRQTKQNQGFLTRVQEVWQNTWQWLPLMLVLMILMAFSLKLPQSLPGTGVALVMVLVIHFGADWIMKTQQSVIFSSSRVSRPLWSFAGLDLLHAILIIVLSRKWGEIGLVGSFVINTGLRIFFSFYFSQKTLLRLGLPRLKLPNRIGLRYQVSFKGFLTGITLPAVEAAFLICSVIYFRAIREMDTESTYQFFLYLVSPLFTFVTSFGFLYYVDFLKFKDRVFNQIYKMLIMDSFRALVFYLVLTVFIVECLNQIGFWEPLELSVIGFVSMVMASWGLFSIGAMVGFIKGLRWTVIGSAFISTFVITAAWSIESLIGFSIVVPMIFGFILLAKSLKRNDSLNTEWISPELFQSFLSSENKLQSLQGVALERKALGFSLSETLERLIHALPKGSQICFRGRSQLYWITPYGTPLSPRELLLIFGVYWKKELTHWEPLKLRNHHEQLCDWKLGEPLPKEMGRPSEKEQRLLFSLMKRRVTGREIQSRGLSIGFRPRFKNQVWVGGQLFRK